MKKLVFYLIMLCMVISIVELGMRAYFAFKVGSNVLWYGTNFFHKDVSAKIKMGKYAGGYETVSYHENERSNYSKYFPKQVRHDTDVNGDRFQVMINSKGFRGKDFADEKKPNVIRIVTLGASSTFGFHDRDNETYPYYMEQILNMKCKGEMSFEVINLGIPHLTTVNIYSLFLNEALPLNPDIVTFYEGINDSEMKNPRGSVREQAKKIAFLRKVFIAAREHLIMVSYLDSILHKRVEAYSEQAVYHHLEGKSKHFLKNVARIYEECKKRNILFIVANQQACSRSLKREDLKGITYQEEGEMMRKKLSEKGKLNSIELYFITHNILMNDLRKWAQTNDIPFVNIIEALDQDRDTLLSWVHLSPKGNRIMAETFAKKIMERTCPL